MQRKDLKFYKKSTPSYELEISEDGEVTDITGWSIYFTIKEKVDDSDTNAKLKKKVTVHSDAISGTTLIELTSSETNITKGNYYYSIDYKTDDSKEGILFAGRLTIEEPILKTRS